MAYIDLLLFNCMQQNHCW